MTSNRTALVIGAGIAGPVTALALRKAGLEVTVFEAYPAGADGVGGVLTLAPNGLAALGLVGVGTGGGVSTGIGVGTGGGVSTGIGVGTGGGDALAAVGQPMPDMVFEDGRGRRIGKVSGLPGLPPSLTLWRKDLFGVLRDQVAAAGVRVEYGKRLTGVQETPDGVIARFEDGSTAHGGVLIGADGIRSTVRELIDPAAPGPEYTGLLGFGVPGTVRVAGGGAGVGVGGDPGTMHFAFGKRAFFGYWTKPDGTVALFSNLPHDQPMTLAEMRRTPADSWLRLLREAHAGDIPAEAILDQTRPEDLMLAGPLEMMPPVPRWYRGRVVLTGDAVHAPSSSSGQGASLSIESAIELARCLRDIPDPRAAFAAYESLRRPRVEKIAANARKTNNNKAAGPVAKKVLSLVAPIALKTFLTPEKMFGPVHRYQIQWD